MITLSFTGTGISSFRHPHFRSMISDYQDDGFGNYYIRSHAGRQYALTFLELAMWRFAPMIYTTYFSTKFERPHLSSLACVYQDDGFGGAVKSSVKTDKQVDSFIFEDLH